MNDDFTAAITQMRATGCLHPTLELALTLREIDPRIELATNNLKLPPDLTREAWVAVGRALGSWAVATGHEELLAPPRKPRKRRDK